MLLLLQVIKLIAFGAQKDHDTLADREFSIICHSIRCSKQFQGFKIRTLPDYQHLEAKKRCGSLDTRLQIHIVKPEKAKGSKTFKEGTPKTVTQAAYFLGVEYRSQASILTEAAVKRDLHADLASRTSYICNWPYAYRTFTLTLVPQIILWMPFNLVHKGLIKVVIKVSSSNTIHNIIKSDHMNLDEQKK